MTYDMSFPGKKIGIWILNLIIGGCEINRMTAVQFKTYFNAKKLPLNSKLPKPQNSQFQS